MSRPLRLIAALGVSLGLFLVFGAGLEAHDCSSPRDCEQTAGYNAALGVAGGLIAIATAVIGAQLAGSVAGAAAVAPVGPAASPRTAEQDQTEEGAASPESEEAPGHGDALPEPEQATAGPEEELEPQPVAEEASAPEEDEPEPLPVAEEAAEPEEEPEAQPVAEEAAEPEEDEPERLPVAAGSSQSGTGDGVEQDEAGQSTTAPAEIDTRVIGGRDAIRTLIDRGMRTVTVDGQTYVLPPTSDWPPGVHGGAWDTTTVIDPATGEPVEVIDNASIEVDWPKPPGDPVPQFFSNPAHAAGALGGKQVHIDGQVYVRPPENLPDNAAGGAWRTRTVWDPVTFQEVEVIDPDSPVWVDYWPQETPPAFAEAAAGTIDNDNPPQRLDLPNDHNNPTGLNNALRNAWEQSLPGGESLEHGGTIVQNPDGSIRVANEGSGTSNSFPPDYQVGTNQVAVGAFHTHPYSASEGGHVDVPFSDGDFLHFFHANNNIHGVQSGESQFLIVRTNQTPENVDTFNVWSTWNSEYNQAVADGADFVERARRANITTADRFNLRIYEGRNGVLELMNRPQTAATP